MNPSRRSWVLAALPVAAVLAVDPSGLSPYGPAKWALVTTLVLAAAATQPGRGRRLVVARAPARAWVVFLVLVALAALVGVDPLYAWIGTPERHFGALAWLLCAVAFVAGQQLDEDDSRFVALAAAGACLLTALWAVAEEIGWEPIRLAGAGDRPVGTLGSSAFLGAAAALLVPACVGIAVDPRWQQPARRAAGVAAGAGTAALIVSGARSAWVGLAVAGGAGLVLRWQRITARRGHWRRVRRRLVTGTVLAVGAAVAFALATGAPSRLFDAAVQREGGALGRFDEWRVATNVILDRPITGAGPEGYRIAFARAVDDDYEQRHGRSPLPDRAHSAILDVAATAGLPGLMVFGLVIALAGRFVLRAVRGGPVWVAGVATGVVAYGVQALFLFPIAELDPVAWLLAGLVVSRVVQGREVRRLRPPRMVPMVASVVAAGALVAGVLDVAADRVARRTLAAAAEDRPTDPERAARLRPDALRYRLVAARAWEASTAAGARGKALHQVNLALDLSPRDPVASAERTRLLLDQARLTRAPADVKAARTALEQLARRDPRNASTLLRLGVARDLAGDAEGAEDAWLAAERLAPHSSAASTNLALSYAEAGRWEDAAAAARRALRRNPDDVRAQQVLDQAEAGGT